MALPLPRVVADVGPGGGLATAMQGLNALNQGWYNTDILRAKAQYAPLTEKANALSKLAYSQLMGPQFIAKLMNNPAVLANMTDDQLKAWLQSVGYAGLNSPNLSDLSDGRVGIPYVANKSILQNRGINTFNNPAPAPIPPPAQNNNAILQNPGLSPQDKQNVQNMQPRDSYVVQGQNQQAPSLPNGPPSKWTENVAQYKGNIAQGEELGKQRAKDINELGTQYAQDVEAMQPLQHLADMSQSPVFMNMRNTIPGFQQLQLSTLKNFGTPEQQRYIGDFISSAQSAIASTVRGFQGRAMAKEFDFANQLKVGENDNINVILGKLESLITYKDATMQRNRIATKLMTEKHMNKGDAYAEANDQVNMKAIRKKIASQLQSPVRVRNTKTGETKYISPQEYNEMLFGK